MLIDGHQDTAYSLKVVLESKGFEVDTFQSPAEALEAYYKNRHALALIDIRMSEMSGFEFARWLWSANPDMQVCFLSTIQITEKEAKKVFPSLKGHCFLKKPIGIDELVSHIAGHLGERQNNSVTSVDAV